MEHRKFLMELVVMQTAVNNTLYMMIKSNPDASNLLDGYKNKLNEASKS